MSCVLELLGKSAILWVDFKSKENYVYLEKSKTLLLKLNLINVSIFVFMMILLTIKYENTLLENIDSLHIQYILYGHTIDIGTSLGGHVKLLLYAYYIEIY